MPFQSEKQRKYLHANHPEIAKRWEKEYATGGISNLFKNRTGFHRGSLRHQKEHDYKSYEDEGNFMKYLLLSGDRASAYGWSPEGGTGPYPWPKIDPDKRMDYRQSRDDFETFMKERFMYGEKKSPLMKSELDKAINAWLKKQYKKLVGRDEGTEGLATGGISNLFKLKEGGNIRLQPHTASDLLVQKTSSGERPKYQPPGHTDAPSRSSDSGGHSQHATANVTSRPAPTPSYQSVHETGAVTQTPGRTTTPDKGDGNIKKGPQEGWTEDEVKKAIKEGERKKELRDLALQGQKTETWEKAQTWNKPNKFMSFLGNAALAIIPGLLPAKMATAYRVGKLGYEIAYTDKYDATIEKFGFNKEEILSKVKGIGDSKLDLYESFADTPNHPERIALQAELEIGKKTPDDVPDRDGVTQETSITIDNIEEVNDAKTQLLKKYEEMEWATYRAKLEQQKMQAKKEAYLRNFRNTYVMAAQGGRIPGGYNTGGLSNLFRLKNV